MIPSIRPCLSPSSCHSTGYEPGNCRHPICLLGSCQPPICLLGSCQPPICLSGPSWPPICLWINLYSLENFYFVFLSPPFLFPLVSPIGPPTIPAAPSGQRSSSLSPGRSATPHFRSFWTCSRFFSTNSYPIQAIVWALERAQKTGHFEPLSAHFGDLLFFWFSITFEDRKSVV